MESKTLDFTGLKIPRDYYLDREENTLKILVVAHESEFIGGANRALFAILKNWKNNNLVEFEVLLPKKNGTCIQELEKMGVIYYVTKYFKVFSESRNQPQDILRKLKVYAKFEYNKMAAKRIKNQICEKGFQLVYSNTRMTSMGIAVAKELKIPHVMHVREFGNENTIWGPSNIKWINENSSAIITISSALKKHLKKMVNSEKIYSSYDGVSYNHKVRIEAKKVNTLNILLTGRITPAKAQDEAISALQILRNNGYKEIKLHLAGSQTSQSKYETEYFNHLQNEIKKYNLNEFVEFHGEVKDMKKLREEMDIELMCALKETFGWVTVEGMRSGLLVIGGNTGATPEIIKNKETGLIYEQGNAKDLADKIIWAINHPEDMLKIRKQAYRYSYNNFTVEQNAKEVLDIIKQILKEK